jgi:hypothetical protein
MTFSTTLVISSSALPTIRRVFQPEFRQQFLVYPMRHATGLTTDKSWSKEAFLRHCLRMATGSSQPPVKWVTLIHFPVLKWVRAPYKRFAGNIKPTYVWSYKYTPTTTTSLKTRCFINPLNAELNPNRHLLALPGAHHFVHVSRVRVNSVQGSFAFARPKARYNLPTVTIT